MLMAHSVEGRFPFLDKDVMRLATELPDRFRLWGLDEKHILKRAAIGYVPESIRRRPKQPYRAPDALAFVPSRCRNMQWTCWTNEVLPWPAFSIQSLPPCCGKNVERGGGRSVLQ